MLCTICLLRIRNDRVKFLPPSEFQLFEAHTVLDKFEAHCLDLKLEAVTDHVNGEGLGSSKRKRSALLLPDKDIKASSLPNP